MAKRKNRSKRSLGSLPKGIPRKPSNKLAHAVGAANNNNNNPFEQHSAGHKRPKHQVHNRFISTQQPRKKTEDGSPLKRRNQHLLKQSLQRAKKANVFVDKRIGEYDRNMTPEEQNLARLVRERSRRSKRSAKFSLQDEEDYNDEGMLLTHGGKVIDDETAANALLMSDDDDDDNRYKGQLDALDTALHFGGGGTNNRFTGTNNSIYGPSSSSGAAPASMAANYSQRKTELDDLILRRRLMKAEKAKFREQQEEVIHDLDENFKELAAMLDFRDKEKEIRKHIQNKREGKLDDAAKEMEDWDQEIREYSFMGKRAKATDRTKTQEEMAKEQAERLHDMETRRLARMNGDFTDDDFSDVSDDEEEKKRNRKRRKRDQKQAAPNPEELDGSDDDADDADRNESGLKAKFTSEGLVYVNTNGEIVKRVDEAAEEEEDKDEEQDTSSEDAGSVEQGDDTSGVLKVGTRVVGNYRAKEQVEDREHWYEGVISQVNQEPDGTVTYNVDYDDGDFEEEMEPESVKPIEKSEEEKERDDEKKEEELVLKRKRQKARERARYVVFSFI